MTSPTDTPGSTPDGSADSGSAPDSSADAEPTGAVPPPPLPPRRTRADAACVAAVDVARAALAELTEDGDVGEHVRYVVEGDRLVTHVFACTRRGYRGWQWAVTVTRASRQRNVTVNESVLLPGDGALVAPSWVPYRDRLQSGDVGPGDVLPVHDDDPRLVPGWLSGDDAVEAMRDDSSVRSVVDEVGLGRVRVLSLEGRDETAARWYTGEHGPRAAVAEAAPDPCRTCGFLVRLAGPLATVFGVCANEVALDDGRVVSYDHGCGAHSQVSFDRSAEPQSLPPLMFDTVAVEAFDLA